MLNLLPAMMWLGWEIRQIYNPSFRGEISLDFWRKLYLTTIFINLLHRNARYSLGTHWISLSSSPAPTTRECRPICRVVERQFTCALSHQIWLVGMVSSESLVLTSFTCWWVWRLVSSESLVLTSFTCWWLVCRDDGVVFPDSSAVILSFSCFERF